MRRKVLNVKLDQPAANKRLLSELCGLQFESAFGLGALLWTVEMLRFVGSGIFDVSYVINERRGRWEGNSDGQEALFEGIA